MSAPKNIPVILLAAGQSSRMRGSDKLMQLIDGQPLVRRQAKLARAVTTGPVIAALPPQPHDRYQALVDLDLQLLPVPDADEGMNASLRRAFEAVPKHAPGAMLLLGDLPDLTESDLRIILQDVDFKSNTRIWRGATQDGKPGHPVVFSADLFDQFKTLSGDSGGREVVQSAKGRVALVTLPGHRARRDLDTPEDWAAWRAEQDT